MEGKELSKSSMKKNLYKRIEAILLGSPSGFKSKTWLARFSLPSRPKKVSPEDGVKVDKTLPKLPDELVEKIMARVSFPFIFKARVLSKSWLARLSSISSQKDEENRRLAISFQKQMLECSPYWKTFCPEGIREGELIAHDCRCHVLQKMPSLSFLPVTLLKRLLPELQSTLQTEGALLLIKTPGSPSLSHSPPFVLVL